MLGKGVSWLTLIMVIVTCVIVVMRYVFDAGLIWLQESVIWMHAVVFMLGAAYTLEQEEHVRTSIQSQMPDGVHLAITYRDQLERGASGKFEEFVSEVAG